MSGRTPGSGRQSIQCPRSLYSATKLSRLESQGPRLNLESPLKQTGLPLIVFDLWPFDCKEECSADGQRGNDEQTGNCGRGKFVKGKDQAIITEIGNRQS